MAAEAERKPMVLVTGGTGLVGHGIRLAVADEGGESREDWYYASSRDADLRSMDSTRALFDRVKPTHVIHLAANVGGLFKNMKYPVEMYRDNMLMNDTVFQVSLEFKVKKVVSCLSTCIFPDGLSLLTEEMVHDGPPHFSNEGYAYAKRMLDVMSRLYSKAQKDTLFTTIVPTNVYGPHDNYSTENGHVVPAMIHRAKLAMDAGAREFCVWGSGTPLRQFIYSKDLGTLLLWVLRSYNDPSPVTLSVGEDAEVSIGDAARTVLGAMGFTGEIVFDTSKADGQFKKTASNAKLMRLHGDFAFTSFADGIKATVEWFKANYETARK